MSKARPLRELNSPSPGILLLSSRSLEPVGFNREAIQILAFPDSSKGSRNPAVGLARAIGEKLTPKHASGTREFVREFKSGSRTYLCRALELGVDNAVARVMNGNQAASTLVLLERPALPLPLRERSTWQKYGLSQRETQMVELLVEGMTTKEMASALDLSPNTIKSFLRMVMVKMGVSTRSGVVGKLVNSERR